MIGETDLIGASLAVFSAVISNFGVNVQKYSHSANSLLPKAKQKAYIFRPLWWIGLLMVVGGSIGDFAAFGFATQALVASLGGGSTLVANMFFAHYFNKEVLRQTDFIGVVWIVIGVVLVAFITDPNQAYTLEELELLFLRSEFLIYICIVCLCVLCFLSAIKSSSSKMSTRSSKQSGEEYLKHQKSSPYEPDPKSYVAYYYASASGIIGAISVLLAKCSALMIARTIDGYNELTHPVTYAFLGGMLLTILLQTHLLNMAIHLGDTMKVYPIFQVFWIGFSVVGGIVFYETAHTFTLVKWFLYPVALLCVIVGVSYLVQHQAKRGSSVPITMEQCVSNSDSGNCEKLEGEEESLKSPLLSSKDIPEGCYEC